MSKTMTASLATSGNIRRPNVLVAVLALSGLVSSMMQTLVAPILPEFPRLLHTSPAGSAWIITATLLAASAATPVAGRLGDMHGKRRILLALLLIMVIGSVVAGFAQDLGTMIIGRALQGTAIGTVPLAISISREALPAERQRGAVSLISASLGFGAAIGLPGATWVADSFGFRVLFFSTALLGLLAIALVRAHVPESRQMTGGSFDGLGAALLTIGLTGVLIAVAQGRVWGWTSTATVICAILGILLLLLFGWWELRCRDPLLDLRIFARRTVILTNLSSATLGFALVVSSVAFPQSLEIPQSSGGAGLSAFWASVAMMPLGVVMVLLTPAAAATISRFGPRIALAAGAVIVALAYTIATLGQVSAVSVIVASGVIGIGIGLGYAAMPTLIMSAVPSTQIGVANGTNTLMRALGTTIGSAVVGTILAASLTGTHTAAPSVHAFQTVFALAVATAIISAVIAAGTPGHRHSSASAAQPDITIERVSQK